MPETTTAAAPAIEPVTTGTKPEVEKDGGFATDAPINVALTSAAAEEVRKKAYKAAITPAGTAPAAEPKADDAAGETVEDEGEFDPENGLDEKGQPIKASSKTGDQTAPDKGAPDKGASTQADASKREVTPATAEERERLVMAKRALRLDGLDDADIAALGDNGRVIKLGAKASERHSRTAAALRDAAEIRRKAAAGEEPPASDSTATRADAGRATTTAAGQRGTPPDRLDALLAELEGNGPQPDPDAPQENPELAATRQALERANTELLNRDAQEGVRKLLGDFPQLRGEDAKKSLYATMDRLDPQAKASGNKDALHQLMREAAYIVFGEQLTERSRQERKERAQRERNGQPENGGDTREPKRAMSAEDRRRAAYEASKAPSREESVRRYHAKVGAA